VCIVNKTIDHNAFEVFQPYIANGIVLSLCDYVQCTASIKYTRAA